MSEILIKEVTKLLEKAEKRAVLTGKGQLKVQSGIYFEKRVDYVIKYYLAELNDYLKLNIEKENEELLKNAQKEIDDSDESEDKKNNKIVKIREVKNVLKTDFIDNVLYNYFKVNKLWDLTLEEMIADKEQIKNLGDKLLDDVYGGLPLRTLIKLEKGNVGLYTDLQIFNKITEINPIIFNQISKSLLINLIVKEYFIKNCGLKKEAFITDSKGYAKLLNHKFNEKHFQNYFKINKLTNDNTKNI